MKAQKTGCFIVIKRVGEKPGDLSHLVFVEWHNKVPIFAPNADFAMVFDYWDMAQFIRQKLETEQTGWLAEGWEVWDMDEIARNNEKARAILDAIFKKSEGEDA